MPGGLYSKTGDCVEKLTAYVPMSGVVEDAGGVLSASNINSTKNATNTFIPGQFTIAYK